MIFHSLIFAAFGDGCSQNGQQQMKAKGPLFQLSVFCFPKREKKIKINTFDQQIKKRLPGIIEKFLLTSGMEMYFVVHETEFDMLLCLVRVRKKA